MRNFAKVEEKGSMKRHIFIKVERFFAKGFSKMQFYVIINVSQSIRTCVRVH